MREAGFSSTQVKTNVEQSVCSNLDQLCSANNQTLVADHPIISNNKCTSASSSSSKEYDSTTNNNNKDVIVQIRARRDDHEEGGTGRVIISNYDDEDVMSVIDNLMRKKRLVIIGERVDSVQGVVRVVMEKVEKGQVVVELLMMRQVMKFISLPLSTFSNLSRSEVDRKLEELRSMKRCVDDDDDRVIVLYLGDLKWITEYHQNSTSSSGGGGNTKNKLYCPVEHMIVEVGRLAHSERFWLLGIASFETYFKCRSGSPSSLESVWGLHPLTLPARSNLGLSLITSTDR